MLPELPSLCKTVSQGPPALLPRTPTSRGRRGPPSPLLSRHAVPSAQKILSSIPSGCLAIDALPKLNEWTNDASHMEAITLFPAIPGRCIIPTASDQGGSL